MNQQSSSSQILPINSDEVEDIVDVNDLDKRNLIKLFVRIKDPTIRSPEGEWILEECKQLFRRDYECRLVDNLDNNIPGVHPKVVIVPVAENVLSLNRKMMNFDVIEYLKQEQESTFTSPTRFPCPVILFNGKYICRSKYPVILKSRQNEQNSEVSSSTGSERPRSRLLDTALKRTELQKISFAKQDVDFLKSIDVSHIIDFNNSTECDFRSDIMSSEQLRNFYEPFEISFMPYPGLDNLDDALKPTVQTTRTYLLNCLQKLIERKGGILIQTFKGYFRASLFTSLLRLSLWADGVIHKKLTMPEMAFLSLGYDWYLFGGRIGADELVTDKMMMLFFSFVAVISTDEYSITRMVENQSQDSSEFPKFQASRREILRIMSVHMMKCYTDSIKFLTRMHENACQ